MEITIIISRVVCRLSDRQKKKLERNHFKSNKFDDTFCCVLFSVLLKKRSGMCCIKSMAIEFYRFFFLPLIDSVSSVNFPLFYRFFQFTPFLTRNLARFVHILITFTHSSGELWWKSWRDGSNLPVSRKTSLIFIDFERLHLVM